MRKAPILTILLIALITLAACGGDDDGEPTAVSVTSTPTEEVAQQPTATDVPATETPQSTAVDPAASGTSSESGILMPEIRTGDIPIDGRFIGDPNAPVTLTEYGDFM